MQRLVDRIWEEFSEKDCHFVEINVLDGNGDPFEVYNGAISELSVYNFSNILRDPCCFYFFNMSSVIHSWNNKNESTILRRELCWLTDPIPPEITERTHNSFNLSWFSAKFCGISPPQNIDSITYSLQICEGVEWKQTKATKFMSDIMATNYKTICSGNNLFSTQINDLKPARWYHFRLVVEYRGLRVVSETRSLNTTCSVPSAPGSPNLYVLPVSSSFDGASDMPSRLDVLICWATSVHNGSPILKYQLQLCGIDLDGNYTTPQITQKRQKSRNAALPTNLASASLLKNKPYVNQWVKSPGKNELQIANSLVFRSKSANSKRLPSSPNQSQIQVGLDGINNQTAFSEMFATSLESPGGHNSSSLHKWTVIYENLNHTMKMCGPHKNEVEWQLRVRCKNGLGWGPYSDILKIGSYTHPSLFHELLPAVPELTLPSHNISLPSIVVPGHSTGLMFNTQNSQIAQQNFNNNKRDRPTSSHNSPIFLNNGVQMTATTTANNTNNNSQAHTRQNSQQNGLNYSFISHADHTQQHQNTQNSPQKQSSFSQNSTQNNVQNNIQNPETTQPNTRQNITTPKNTASSIINSSSNNNSTPTNITSNLAFRPTSSSQVRFDVNANNVKSQVIQNDDLNPF